MIRTLRSLPEPAALAAWVAAAYGLEVTRCVLIRSLVNDVYEVGTPDRRYVLKLYRPAYWSLGEVEWEAALINHLATTGIATPSIEPSADERLVVVLDSAEGDRLVTLSPYLAGRKPEPPFDDELYRGFGRLVAAVHDAADKFRTSHARRPADLQRRLNEPLASVLPALTGPDRAMVSELADAAQVRITEYAAAGLNWGICHGDVTLDNVMLTDRGMSIYDFDLAGEGWRAADLTGVAATPHWDAFADGYISRRDLSPVELAAIPWLAVVGRVFNLRFHLVDKPLLRGTESTAEGWAAGELAELRRAASQLL